MAMLDESGIPYSGLRTKCEYPDCPSRFIGEQLLAELKVIQDKQDEHKEIQKAMVKHFIAFAGVQSDLMHVKEDLRKNDGRIVEAFLELKKKADIAAVPPDVVTRRDVKVMMTYTSLIFVILVALVQWLPKIVAGARALAE